MLNILSNYMLFVAGAGNDGTSFRAYWPASHPGVMGVAATNSLGKRAYFSNYNTDVVEIAAPGMGIWTADMYGLTSNWFYKGYVAPGEKYGSTPYGECRNPIGTSYSSPIVAGVAALVLSGNPDLTPAEVRWVLTETMKPTAPTETDLVVGIVDAYDAVLLGNTL